LKGLVDNVPRPAKFLTGTSSLTFLIIACGMASNTLAVVDFKQCFQNIVQTNTTDQTGGVDSVGHSVANISNAMGITYERCVEWCGSGPESFDFPSFSRKFTAWLLPWLALISQLPFNGSNDTVDDVLSVALAVGSPTLAGYSLVLTVLNERWLNGRIKGMKDVGAGHMQTYGSESNTGSRNKLKREKTNLDAALEQVEIVLNRLQTMSLAVSGDQLTSLAEQHLTSSQHEPNDGAIWWRNMQHELNYPPSGTVSATTALGWVFIAYLFTVIDAFQSLQDVQDTFGVGSGLFVDGISDGQGVGSIWLWLLPVVVGWLFISPKYQYQLNHRAFERSSTTFAIRAPTLDGDKGRSAPIFNYARFITWTKDVEQILDEYQTAYEVVMRGVVRPAQKDTTRQLVDSGPARHPDVGRPSGPQAKQGNKYNNFRKLLFISLFQVVRAAQATSTRCKHFLYHRMARIHHSGTPLGKEFPIIIPNTSKGFYWRLWLASCCSGELQGALS
jgi:hypothetical protein